jgi:succinate dehydrogenase / fumarate reductase membrane anchor subunit
MFRSVIEWYLQRITGALLLVLLVAHFWVEHFMTEPLRRGELSYSAILSRISNPYWQAIDISFLIIALYHGLNGLRNIILDYSRISKGAARAATVILVLIGFLWAYWGIDAFRNL